MLSDADAAGLDQSRTEYLTGPAGSITIHNARTLHYLAVVQISRAAPAAAELLHSGGCQALYGASATNAEHI